MNNINIIMDLSNRKIVKQYYDNPNDIIDSLLNNYLINVDDLNYKIHEVEVYLRSKEFNDEYVHSNPDQLLFGKWYFHKYKNGTYKNGTYKGVDLTLGNNKNVYFGVLIRAICPLNTNIIIEGPCNCVNVILNHNNFSDVKSLMDSQNYDILDAFNNSYFKLIKCNVDNLPIYVGPRIGLSNKYPKYRNIPFRYVTRPDLIRKEKSKLKKQ
jgi:3-methyladenine DNA glycosylase Mpg